MLLVVGMFALLGIVAGVDYGKQKIGDIGSMLATTIQLRHRGCAARRFPRTRECLCTMGRGDISVRSSDDTVIRVSAKNWRTHVE